jgi:hypothetical protein
MMHCARFLSTLEVILIQQVISAKLVAGDISRRKKVKEKRPSPFLFYVPSNLKRRICII